MRQPRMIEEPRSIREALVGQARVWRDKIGGTVISQSREGEEFKNAARLADDLATRIKDDVVMPPIELEMFFAEIMQLARLTVTTSIIQNEGAPQAFELLYLGNLADRLHLRARCAKLDAELGSFRKESRTLQPPWRFGTHGR